VKEWVLSCECGCEARAVQKCSALQAGWRVLPPVPDARLSLIATRGGVKRQCGVRAGVVQVVQCLS